MIKLSDYKNYPVLYLPIPPLSQLTDATSEASVTVEEISNMFRFGDFVVVNAIGGSYAEFADGASSQADSSLRRALIMGKKVMLGCDAVILGWPGGFTPECELEYARSLKIPIFKLNWDSTGNNHRVDYWKYPTDSDPKAEWMQFSGSFADCLDQMHQFINRYAVQNLAFKELSAYGYHLMVRKNKDYSPSNIKGTGKVGIATRLWDKCARYLNLIGFDLETGDYSEPKNPNNESIEDNLLDMANYAHIANIHLAGKWGIK